jgi:hypothetical protein
LPVVMTSLARPEHQLTGTDIAVEGWRMHSSALVTPRKQSCSWRKRSMQGPSSALTKRRCGKSSSVRVPHRIASTRRARAKARRRVWARRCLPSIGDSPATACDASIRPPPSAPRVRAPRSRGRTRDAKTTERVLGTAIRYRGRQSGGHSTPQRRARPRRPSM